MSEVTIVEHFDGSGRIYGYELEGEHVFILYRHSASEILWKPAISIPATTLDKLNKQVKQDLGRGEDSQAYANNVSLS